MSVLSIWYTTHPKKTIPCFLKKVNVNDESSNLPSVVFVFWVSILVVLICVTQIK